MHRTFLQNVAPETMAQRKQKMQNMCVLIYIEHSHHAHNCNMFGLDT